MCCYWKPSGKSNTKGFLDKDECAAINDDQYCDLDFYKKRKKKEYGLDGLEIVCPSVGDVDYCKKIYCTDITEVGADGAEYCSRRAIDNGDKYCAMWNPDKETTNVPDYAWLSGKTRCKSISDAQFADLYNFEKKARQDTGMPNLQIVVKEKTSNCKDILDINKCKYSLENDRESDICCKWSVPDTTITTTNFWLINDQYKQNNNYERCVSMTKDQTNQLSTYSKQKQLEYGLSNPIKMECDEGGNNEIPEIGIYRRKSGESLKISIFGLLVLFYLLA